MQNPFITAPRLAVLIDAENISPAWSAQLMAQVAERGAATIRRAYAHAIAERYRFFSYGDAMFLTRTPA